MLKCRNCLVAYQFITSSLHRFITPYQHFNISTAQHLNISTSQHLNISTFQHSNIPTYSLDPGLVVILAREHGVPDPLDTVPFISSLEHAVVSKLPRVTDPFDAGYVSRHKVRFKDGAVWDFKAGCRTQCRSEFRLYNHLACAYGEMPGGCTIGTPTGTACDNQP